MNNTLIVDKNILGLIEKWGRKRGVIDSSNLSPKQKEDFQEWINGVNFIKENDFDWDKIKDKVVLFYENLKGIELDRLSLIWDELMMES